MLNPVFLAQNRMLTRVVAKKQAATTKVKNKFVNGKKKVQKNTQLSFWWKAKVQFRQKKLGDKVQAKSSNLSCQFCCELSRHTARVRSFSQWLQRQI